MEKVSVIIATYNRFKFLLNTIKSIKTQTYQNIEIIVVNDCSTEKNYYNYDWNLAGVSIIHLEHNSRKIIGFPCAGFVRNKGINIATGKWIAFCDDDDIWFPNKLELQLNAMKKTGCKMSSTNALYGYGDYHELKRNTYKLFFDINDNLPNQFTKELILKHNYIICSSVIIDKSILDIIQNFPLLKNGKEDYNCWLKALDHTNSIYVPDICIYYDNKHGYGKNY